MCTPLAAGGRRCATHTRPAFRSALDQVQGATTPRSKVEAQASGITDIARHAATPAGSREVRHVQDIAKESGDASLWLYLEGCLNVAQGIREMQATIDEEVSRRTATRPTRDAAQHK